MNIINEPLNNFSKWCNEQYNSITSRRDYCNFDFNLFKNRAEVIDVLKKIKKNITVTLQLVEEILHEFQKDHNADIKMLQSVIDVDENIPATFPVIAEKNHIKIVDDLYIPAYIVKMFDDVKRDGELYYVTSAKHFAIYICDVLYSGNIGVINDQHNNKVRDCKYKTGCSKYNDCGFYHDPKKYPGSTDCRNFNISSTTYLPPPIDNNDKYEYKRGFCCKFGSREYLLIDLVNMKNEEVNKYNDMVMHFILCSVILNKQIN